MKSQLALTVMFLNLLLIPLLCLVCVQFANYYDYTKKDLVSATTWLEIASVFPILGIINVTCLVAYVSKK
jgi:hypothetical protein